MDCAAVFLPFSFEDLGNTMVVKLGMISGKGLRKVAL